MTDRIHHPGPCLAAVRENASRAQTVLAGAERPCAPAQSLFPIPHRWRRTGESPSRVAMACGT